MVSQPLIPAVIRLSSGVAILEVEPIEDTWDDDDDERNQAPLEVDHRVFEPHVTHMSFGCLVSGGKVADYSILSSQI